MGAVTPNAGIPATVFQSFGGNMKIVSGLIILFLTLPIWFYLMYKVLELVGATELMWFLYWIYVPFSILAGILARVAEE